MSNIPKFRAWHKGYKEMSQVRVLDIENSMVQIFSKRGSIWLLDEIELMQWTGLQDRNGADIYADDIIEYLEEKFIVPHAAPVSRWNKAKNINPRGDDNDDWNSWLNDCYEIIGNIYENEKLLETYSDE